METWQLIISIAGVVIGFLVGFFAEPVKTFFSNAHERNLLRQAMYKEMAFFYARMVDISSNQMDYDWETYKKSLQSVARFECYEYAKSKPMLFYQIEESPAINQVYANYSTYVDGYIFKSVEQHISNAKGLVEIIEDLILSKRLNRTLFLKSIDKDHGTSLSKHLAQKEGYQTHK